MVGNGFSHLIVWSWMYFDVVIAFTLVILALNFIIKGMEDVFLEDHQVKEKKRTKRRLKKEIPECTRQELDFTFIHADGK